MSRIQDILAKAERDGTATRLPSTSGYVPASPRTAVLDLPPVDLPPATSRPESPAAAAPEVPRPTEAAAVRTARPTLHPALIAAIDPHSEVAEQYRAIRTRLAQREEMGPLRSIAITSPAPRDGKSITAANLALTMAQELQRNVVLVDADLRTPSVHALFAVDRGPGLSEVLTGDATLEEALIHLPDLGLVLLPAGASPDYPTELLGSTAMRRTLDALASRFDRVLVDLPPVTPLADVGTVVPVVDGALMVIRAGVTQRPALDQALAAFEDDKVLGVVLNDKA